MDGADLLRTRLASELLTGRVERSPLEIVEWFGAMQAQDLESGLWAIGVRGAGLTRFDVERSIEAGEILRSWPMRGTIHFVPAEDIHWMLALTGVRSLPTARRRQQQLGLDEATVHRAADLLGDALTGGNCLDRTDCTMVLQRAGIPTDGQRAYHLLWFAAHLGITCIGPQRGKQQTFVLLDEWVPNPRRLERDEALAELGRRYFRSHGPATRHDLARWTGLTLADATRAVAAVGDELVQLPGDDGLLMSAAVDVPARARRRSVSDVLLLPGFDEHILGYRDRAPMVDAAYADRIVPGNNGMFMATVADAGRVVGTWRRTILRGALDVRVAPFSELSARQWSGVRAAAERYRRYLGATSIAVRPA